MTTGTTMVSFSPVKTANAALFDSVRLTDPAGVPLDASRCRMVSPSGAGTTGMTVGPVFDVDGSLPFDVSFSGSTIQTPDSLAISIVRAGETRTLLVTQVLTSTLAHLTVGLKPGELVYTVTPASTTSITQTWEASATSYRLVAKASPVTTAGAVNLRSYLTPATTVIAAAGVPRTQWTMQTSSTNVRGRSSFHTAGLKVSAGDQLVMVYRGWSGSRGTPHLWVDRGADGTLNTQVPLTRGYAL